MDKTHFIYTIEEMVNGKRITTHIHNLRPFNYDPERTMPLVIAQHNEQEFVVDSIVGHRGNRTKRSTMEFKVRGQALENHVIVGNPTRPFSMSKRLPSSEHDEDFNSKRTQIFSGWNPTYLHTTYFVHNTIHITHRITNFTHICDTAVRTKYVLPVTSPVSHLTQTSFHHTFCTVHTVHSVCSHLILSSFHSVLMLHSCS